MWPPPWRGLSSTSRGPHEVIMTSVWLSPWRRPTAATASEANRAISSAAAAGRAAGNMCPDSTKAGAPVTLLSVMPMTVVRPSTVAASTLTSTPTSASSSRTTPATRWPRVLRT